MSNLLTTKKTTLVHNFHFSHENSPNERAAPETIPRTKRMRGIFSCEFYTGSDVGAPCEIVYFSRYEKMIGFYEAVISAGMSFTGRYGMERWKDGIRSEYARTVG